MSDTTVTPGVLALIATRYAAVLGKGYVPPVKALTTTKYAPVLKQAVIPPLKTLTLTRYAPVIKHKIITGRRLLSLIAYTPTVTRRGFNPIGHKSSTGSSGSLGQRVITDRTTSATASGFRTKLTVRGSKRTQ